MKVGSLAGAAFAGMAATAKLGVQEARAQGGFQAATSVLTDGPDAHGTNAPGIQGIHALCEVTGGGEKVYGIAAEYDAVIEPASLALDTYATSVFPSAKGFFPGMPQEPNKNLTTDAAKTRSVVAIYTNAEPALLNDKRSVAGRYVIAEFEHDTDLSIPTADGDKVTLIQAKNIKTTDGTLYSANATMWDNAGPRGNNVVIRGVDAWEQSHWWWDDTRSA